MRVVRGRAETIERDRAVTGTLAEDCKTTGRPAIRVWTPHRQVAFGRRDTHAIDYDRAKAAARNHGFPPHERDVGGRAVAYTGTTVAFLRVEPVADLRTGIDERYDAITREVREALATVGVDAVEGEPDRSFCPGAHSLSANGQKLVGIAQRIAQGAAQTAGIVLVQDHERLAAVLDDVYAALDLPFNPDTVGSVERADGTADPDAVARALEDALTGGDRDVEYVEGSSSSREA